MDIGRKNGPAGVSAKTWGTGWRPNLVSATLYVRYYQKSFERVIAERLRKHFWGKCALRADQYGFRAGRSTIDLTGKLKKLAASAIKKHQFSAANDKLMRTTEGGI